MRASHATLPFAIHTPFQEAEAWPRIPRRPEIRLNRGWRSRRPSTRWKHASRSWNRQYAKNRAGGDSPKIAEQIRRLRRELAALKREIYSHLEPWQIVQVSRHQQRPQTRDYIELIFDQFLELHGDRALGDDHAIVTGFAHLDDIKVMFIGHQKGKNLAERKKCNFGCAHPEGYRKAIVKMRLAAKFGLPIIAFIDTPGAYPGISAEERGQAAIIAENLMAMSQLRTPDRRRRDWRGRLGRSARNRNRRPAGHARIHLLLGDQPRRLCLHSLEGKRTCPQSGGRPQDDQPRPSPLRHHRRGHRRAARRRPSRSPRGSRQPEDLPHPRHPPSQRNSH